MNEVMLDLETLSLENNAAIIAIGAVRFDDKGILDTFYQNVDLESSVKHGLHIDPATIKWWMQQDDDARAMLNKDLVWLEVALQRFTDWLGVNPFIWGNGAAFDNVVIKNAYKAIGSRAPWGYKNDMCYRTVKTLNPLVPYEFEGVAHCAVDDAKNQAMHLIQIRNGH